MAESVISSNHVICNGDFDYYKPEIDYNKVDSFYFKLCCIKDRIEKLLHIPTIGLNLSLKHTLKDTRYCLDLKFIESCDAGQYKIARIILDEAEKNNYIIEPDAFYKAFECCLLNEDDDGNGIKFAEEIYIRSNRQIDIFRDDGKIVKECMKRKKIKNAIFLCHLEPNHYYLTVDKSNIVNNVSTYRLYKCQNIDSNLN